MSKMTIYKLAQMLDMTPSMVSRAFSPSGKVSPEKRELILETARKYDFVPNKMASRLSMKSISIGIVINTSFKINADKMVRGIEAAYENLKDYKISYDITLLENAKENDENCRNALLNYADYDGVIIAGFSADRYKDAINELYAKNHNVVQVQAINENADYLFASKHNEATASEVAAEFLYNCLKRSESKNILLFIGDPESLLHIRAKAAFEKACEAFGLNIIETVSTKGSEERLKTETALAFKKHNGKIDGIYSTSGFSYPVCEYLESEKKEVDFVAFDTHDQIKNYLKKGFISATISQDITSQMQSAFEKLVMHIINGETPEKTVYTDVQLVLKSNMHLFS